MSGVHPSTAATSTLAAMMWWYASAVLEPARALRARGIPVVAPPSGDDLHPMPSPGLGPRFARQWPSPRLLDSDSEHSHLVTEFEQMAQVYDAFVRPFSTPIFAEALRILRPMVAPDARALDAGCGPGRELKEVARLVPRGEVVGIDLAAEMVTQARASARASGLDNTAFAQADVGRLPDDFIAAFDLVYCCLAHHHYPDPPAAAAAIHRALRPGGVYAVVDPGPAWFTASAAPLARESDPGWVSFHTQEQFRKLLLDAGFARVRVHELLPGFLLVLAQRAGHAA
ncbi:class I SAM-dependent methyltransferase [Actinoplanes sp. GCM10030250]|uniref:class I SAM-dependent methyltransferase n=1 Tax=Actinoplanes sp. GCM10030250 TaxID=3273376 RepID=UPI00361F393B